MSTKATFITICILIILLLALSVFLFWGRSDSEPIERGFTELPGEQTSRPVASSERSATRYGSPVLADGILGHPDTTQVTEDGLYKNTASPDSYAIFYYEPNGSVEIILYQEPLAYYRLLAEEQLQDLLSATQEELCGMDIQVITNEHVNPVYSKGDLGLSFCPGSVEFE